MKRFFLVTVLVLLFSLMFTGVAWAQEGGDEVSSGEIAVLLAPLLAAATAVERVIEMIFDWYESIILNISKFPEQVKDYLTWARKEVQRLQEEVWKNSGDVQALERAEEKLAQAKDRIHEYLKSPSYTSWKRTISLVLGIVLGLIIAFSTQLQMFHFLGIELPLPWIDVLITGLVIGTGSAPVHSLIGLLQNTKDAVDEARALWKGSAYSKGVQAELEKLKALMEMEKERRAAAPPQKRPRRVTAAPPGEEAPEEVAAEELPPVSDLEISRRVRRILR